MGSRRKTLFNRKWVMEQYNIHGLSFFKDKDLNIRDVKGNTPFFYAFGHLPGIEDVLIKAGADANAINSVGKNALLYFLSESRPGGIEVNYQYIHHLVFDFGIDLNVVTSDGVDITSELVRHMTSIYTEPKKYFKILQDLIMQGFNVHLHSIVHHCFYSPQSIAPRALGNLCCNKILDLKNEKGETSLMVFIKLMMYTGIPIIQREQNEYNLKILIRGSDVAIQNNTGETALDMAVDIYIDNNNAQPLLQFIECKCCTLRRFTCPLYGKSPVLDSGWWHWDSQGTFVLNTLKTKYPYIYDKVVSPQLRFRIAVRKALVVSRLIKCYKLFIERTYRPDGKGSVLAHEHFKNLAISE